MADKTEKDNLERRWDSRLPVVWQGTVTTLDDEVFPCGICDVSTAGTLIKCAADLSMNTQVVLTIDGIGDFASRVQWISGDQTGMQLLVGPDMLLKRFAEASQSYPSTAPGKLE